MDARFADAADRPLRLTAQDGADLEVISALLQDAVGKAGDLVWMKGRRRLAMFLNRFRWEDAARAGAARRPVERVRAVLLVEGVSAVRAAGIDPRAAGQPLSLLRLAFDPDPTPEDPAGVVRLILAGGAEVAATVEYLDLRLEDVTRPWLAPSGRTPAHPLDD